MVLLRATYLTDRRCLRILELEAAMAINRSSVLANERAAAFVRQRAAHVVAQLHSLSTRTGSVSWSSEPEFKFKHLTRNCSSTNVPFVVVDDEKYGNKQVISITPRLYDYILANVREPAILRQLREETATMRGSQMQVSPDQAQFLAMLVRIVGAKRCIEVGVYTLLRISLWALANGCFRGISVADLRRNGAAGTQGYSSLAVALVLPESGCLVACERDAKSLDIAKKYYKLAGVSDKVTVKHGLAADTLKSLIENGEACSYDFAFVDAEKKMNQEYFELLLRLVRAGGAIVVDNVLWHGKVADPLVNDPKTVGIRNFNKNLMEDKRVSISMVPIGDGMTICWKR